jgi:hypothetical protein
VFKRAAVSLHFNDFFGSSLYRVGEAEAMLSLCLCASVVLLEMLAIIIPTVTESNHRDTEAQSKKGLDEIES